MTWRAVQRYTHDAFEEETPTGWQRRQRLDVDGLLRAEAFFERRSGRKSQILELHRWAATESADIPTCFSFLDASSPDPNAYVMRNHKGEYADAKEGQQLRSLQDFRHGLHCALEYWSCVDGCCAVAHLIHQRGPRFEREYLRYAVPPRRQGQPAAIAYAYRHLQLAHFE